MVKGKVILFLFILALLPFISSQPPVFAEEGTFTEGYFVEFTPLGEHTVNTSFQVNAHVYNLSNGAIITKDTTDCFLSLFNRSGHHLLNNINMTYDPVGQDWDFNIQGGNFTTYGDYVYLVSCQAFDDTLGGFVAIEFDVNYAGKFLTEAQAIFYGVILLFLFFFFGMVVYAQGKLPEQNEKDEQGELIQRSWLKYLRSVFLFVQWLIVLTMFFIFSNLSFWFLNETLVADTLFMFYKIMMGLTLPIIALWFIWIFTSIMRDKTLKRMMEKGLHESPGHGGRY